MTPAQDALYTAGIVLTFVVLALALAYLIRLLATRIKADWAARDFAECFIPQNPDVAAEQARRAEMPRWKGWRI